MSENESVVPPWSMDPDPEIDQAEARRERRDARMKRFISPEFGVGFADRGLVKQERAAEWFSVWAEESARFTWGRGWQYWDGVHWARDEGGARVAEMLRQCMLVAMNEAARLAAEAEALKAADPVANKSAVDGKTARAGGLVVMAQVTHTAAGFDGTLRLAASRMVLHVDAAAWDPDWGLLNTPLGTLDLRNWETREPRPRDLITKKTLAVWRAGQTPLRPVWDKFIAEVLPDPKLRAYVQQALGQALVGRVTEHILLVFHGEGRNGKGVMLRAVRKALGDYAIEVSPEIILQQRNTRHETELMDLMGVRLAVMQETSEHRVLDAGKVKALTGGDDIRAQWMRKDKQEFAPSHTLVLATNSKPRVGEGDAGTWRRLKLVPFVVNITAEQEDNTLDAKLEAEAEGVLAWLLEGLAEYQRAGRLIDPEVVVEATREYQEESNPFEDFLRDTAERVAGERVSPAQVLARWTTWARVHGERLPINHRTLKAHMVRAGFEGGKSNGVRYWEGLRFKTETWGELVEGME